MCNQPAEQETIMTNPSQKMKGKGNLNKIKNKKCISNRTCGSTQAVVITRDVDTKHESKSNHLKSTSKLMKRNVWRKYMNKRHFRTPKRNRGQRKLKEPETKDNSIITDLPQQTKSPTDTVKRCKINGYKCSEDLNFHVREDDCNLDIVCQNAKVQSQDNLDNTTVQSRDNLDNVSQNTAIQSQDSLDSVCQDTTVQKKLNLEENETFNIETDINECEINLFVRKYQHLSFFLYKTFDPECKKSHNLTLNSSLKQRLSDELTSFMQNSGVMKDVHGKEIADLKEHEVKQFNTQEKGSYEEEVLEQFFYSQRNIKIRTDIFVYMSPPKVMQHPLAIDDIPWNWLNEEKWRLHTYSRYPHGANKSAILLAEGGFAYLGSGKGRDDKVICYFCCKVKQDWQTSDVISVVHEEMSPQCPIITGIHCNNVAMTAPEIGMHLFGQLQNRGMYADGARTQKHDHDVIEADSPSACRHHADDRRSNLADSSNGSDINFASAHVAHPIQTADHSDIRSNSSNSSSSGQSAKSTSGSTQPSNSHAPSDSMSLNRNPTHSSNPHTEVPNRTQISRAQESGNNTSSVNTSLASGTPATRAVQASTQNIQQVSNQTTAGSQVSQVSSSTNQNTSTVTVASTTTSSSSATSTSTAIRSTTTVTNTSNVNQSTNPSQVQGTISHTTVGETQNNSRTVTGRSPTYGELGIITERPKRFEFAVRAKRFESFEPWPRDHHLKKEDLSDAGFYYAGYGDCARCFYCGGGLRNWEDNDNVWVEHARWFPKCAFIRQTMGQQFVDTVQELNRDNDQISFEMVTTKMGNSAASFQLDTKNMPLKRDPAIITVLDMGYNEADIFEAANFVKETFGILSADKLYETLEHEGKPRTKKDTTADSQAIRSTKDTTRDELVMNQLKEQNNQLRQQTVCKICMDKEVAVVFLPCGHLVSCTDCAAALKDCPVCRNTVRGIVRAFMA